MYTIVISQKAYSSWSLRGWLLLEAFGFDYTEQFVPLYDPAFDEMKKLKAPARTVPILEWTEAQEIKRVWESVAIAETLAEHNPAAGVLPSDPGHRSIARILVAEMHAGFSALRGACPMNLHRTNQPLEDTPAAVRADVARAGDLWSWALTTTGGPWLAGPEFSAADVFHAPLASRLVSYGLLTPETEAYATQVMAHPAVRKWTAAALADPQRIALYDNVT
ncbi:glutathione S-transferase [Amaricoccus tamworthensis]|uniref:glutathione S-transferase n=1 Tax=Amaricoccus tamworthensis TaxID=57002 RepID=UPI003C7B1F9F